MEVFSMGGYGAYVWSCYGLTFVIVVFLNWRGRLRQKRIYREIEVRLKALEEENDDLRRELQRIRDTRLPAPRTEAQ